MGEPPVLSRSEAPVRHVIKRYSNRKLYDTLCSRYVTLVQVADMVRAGEEVQIIDNATKLDKTEFTMALIISEELKERPRTIPLDTLKALIQNRYELLTGRWSETAANQDSIPDSQVRKASDRQLLAPQFLEGDDRLKSALISSQQESKPEQHASPRAESSKQPVDAHQVQALQSQVSRLSERIAELERRLAMS